MNSETAQASIELRRAVDRQPRCRNCGAPLAAPLAGGREEYGCESCCLAARRRHLLPGEADDARFALAEALACALDACERKTGRHSKRVACHTLVLARRFTDDPSPLRQVCWGALLHDIGKIGIPDSILLQPGPLDAAEWAVMRTHPEIGHRILRSAPFLGEAAENMPAQERFEGSGSPRQRSGRGIPLGARLFAVIDALDAMTSDRPYRNALAFDAAREEIVRAPGGQFDPLAVEAFLAEEPTLREMAALKCSAAPGEAVAAWAAERSPR